MSYQGVQRPLQALKLEIISVLMGRPSIDLFQHFCLVFLLYFFPFNQFFILYSPTLFFFCLHIKINIEMRKLYMLQLCALMNQSCDQRHFIQHVQINWLERNRPWWVAVYLGFFFLDIKFVFQYRSLKTHKDKNHRHYINASKLIDYLHLLNSDFWCPKNSVKVSSVHEVWCFCLFFSWGIVFTDI